MSYTNTTEHYKLPQYIGTDKPTELGDFNTAMEIIDKQMYLNQTNASENVGNVSGLQTEVAGLSASVSQANANITNLENQSNTLSTNVTQAQTNAQEALTQSQNANQTAQSASTAATDAQSTASQAQIQASANQASIEELDARVKVLEGDAPEPEPVNSKCTFSISATQSGSTETVSNVQASMSGTTSMSVVVDFAAKTVTFASHSQGGTVRFSNSGTQISSGNITGSQSISNIKWTE